MHKKIGAIANGINLDHIPQGNAWYIIQFLKLERKYPVGIGLNLLSKRMGVKDLIKIENYRLTPVQLHSISIFAHGATYSEIENYQIITKRQLTLPDQIATIIVCPNIRCISRQYRSLFKFQLGNSKLGQHIIASCHYCEHNYALDQLNGFNLAC